jgi:hypothetical protein
MSVVLWVGAFGWLWLRRTPLLWATVPASSAVSAIALMALMVLMIVVPYRLFFKSEAPEVLYQQERCFVTGRTPEQSLLFCPGWPQQKRTRVVKSSELPPSERTVAIFSPLAAEPPK